MNYTTYERLLVLCRMWLISNNCVLHFRPIFLVYQHLIPLPDPFLNISLCWVLFHWSFCFSFVICNSHPLFFYLPTFHSLDLIHISWYFLLLHPFHKLTLFSLSSSSHCCFALVTYFPDNQDLIPFVWFTFLGISLCRALLYESIHVC